MQNKTKYKIISAALAIILLASITVGTVSYYLNSLNEKNSKISSLSDEIANLTAQISTLKSQVASLKANATSPHLVSTLTTKEISWITIWQMFGGGPPYNFVEVTGSVTNIGGGTAFNTGLHVIGYDGTGVLAVNVTVPLNDENYPYAASFGSDKATDPYGTSSWQLGSLGTGKTATIYLDIFHEGTISNWTATPVWTNSA